MEKETAGRNWLSAILRGAAVSLIAYFLLLAFAAYLTVNGCVGEHLAGRAALICAMLAMLAGTIACIGGKRADARLLLCCTAAFCTVVLTVGFLTRMELSLRQALRLILAALAGTVPALIRRGGKDRKGRRRKKKSAGR